MSITEVQFRGLSVDEMWNAYKKMQIDKEAFDQLTIQLTVAVEKITRFEATVSKMQDEIQVNKAVNLALKKSVHLLQAKVTQIDQYGRRDSLEISGVPKDATNLEEKAIQLLKIIGVNVSPTDIVACHPLKREGTVILKFVNRKNAERALSNRNKLRNKDTTCVWGTNCVNYINANLSPENLKLRWYAKNLKLANHISNFGCDDKGIWVKSDEGERKKRVYCREDLEYYTPNNVSLDQIC